MKKMIIAVVTVILVLGITGILYAFAHLDKKGSLPEAGVIQEEEDALVIGMTIIKRVYPQFDYDNMKWSVLYDPNSEEWCVFCYEKEDMLGGGTPQIGLKKSTGEVVYVNLMA